MRALGVDLSLACTGVALPDGKTETLEPARGDGIRRLGWLRDAVLDRVVDHDVELVALEDFVTRTPAASSLGMLHGVVRLALLELEHAPVVLVPPATLKTYACGKGNATKADMRLELYKRAELDLRDDNEVDAWWLRALVLDLAGEPVLELPQTHRRALTKLVLPTEV